MPRGNGTGPRGAGAMTGRGAGYCAGWGTPGFANYGAPVAGPWCRMGMGRGAGRGWRNMFYATGLPGWLRGGASAPTPDQQKAALKAQTEALEQHLAALKQRLSELDSAAEK